MSINNNVFCVYISVSLSSFYILKYSTIFFCLGKKLNLIHSRNYILTPYLVLTSKYDM